MPVTPEFRRQRHEENKFEASLGYLSGTLAQTKSKTGRWRHNQVFKVILS